MKNSMWYYSVVLFAILVTGGCAQEAKPGPCKKIEKIPNFKSKKYLGRWYEFARTARVYEDDKSCMQFDYSNVISNDYVLRVNRYYTIQSDKYNETKIFFFNKETGEGLTSDGYPFMLVDIDYKRYVVIYACVNIGDTHKEITWINTRDRTPAEDVFHGALKATEKYGLNPDDLIITNQSNCPNSFKGAKKI